MQAGGEVPGSHAVPPGKRSGLDCIPRRGREQHSGLSVGEEKRVLDMKVMLEYTLACANFGFISVRHVLGDMKYQDVYSSRFKQNETEELGSVEPGRCSVLTPSATCIYSATAGTPSPAALRRPRPVGRVSAPLPAPGGAVWESGACSRWFHESGIVSPEDSFFSCEDQGSHLQDEHCRDISVSEVVQHLRWRSVCALYCRPTCHLPLSGFDGACLSHEVISCDTPYTRRRSHVCPLMCAGEGC